MCKANLIKIYLCFFLAVLLKANLKSQVLLTDKKELKYKIIDTIKIDGNLRGIEVEWLNDTILINKRNDNYTIDTTQGEKYTELMEASAQNCYSYALEKYFENDSVYSQNLFYCCPIKVSI